MNSKNIIDRDQLSYGNKLIDEFFETLPSYLDENTNILDDIMELDRKYDNYFSRSIDRERLEELVRKVDDFKWYIANIRDYRIRPTILAYDLAEGDVEFASELIVNNMEEPQQS